MWRIACSMNILVKSICTAVWYVWCRQQYLVWQTWQCGGRVGGAGGSCSGWRMASWAAGGSVGGASWRVRAAAFWWRLVADGWATAPVLDIALLSYVFSFCT